MVSRATERHPFPLKELLRHRSCFLTIFPSLATCFTLEPAKSSASLCFLPDTGWETVVSIPQLITGNIEAFWDAGFVVVMNSLHPQPKPTDFSSSLLGEHLPPLFFLKV